MTQRTLADELSALGARAAVRARLEKDFERLLEADLAPLDSEVAVGVGYGDAGREHAVVGGVLLV